MLSISELNEIYQHLIKASPFTQWRQDHINTLNVINNTVKVSPATYRHFQKHNIQIHDCNIVAVSLQTVLGIEIQNSSKIKATINNYDNSAKDVEDAINQYLNDLQSMPSFSQNVRDVFKDALIGGLGALAIEFENYTPIIRRINPLNIVVDMFDPSPNLSEQQIIFTWSLMPWVQITEQYGVKLENSENIPAKDKYLFNPNSSILHDNSAMLPTDLFSSSSMCPSQNIVFKVYVKQESTAWRLYFDDQVIEIADENIIKQLPHTDNVEKIKSKIYEVYTICCGNIIKHEKFSPTTPNSFAPITFLVLNRKELVPTGFCSDLAQQQLSLNETLSIVHSAVQSEKTFIYSDNPELHQKAIEHPEDIQAPDALVALSSTDRVQTVRQSELLSQYSNLLTMQLNFLKRTSGVEDESKGIPTGAISGSAIRLRDNASIRANTPSFVKLDTFKKHLGSILIKQLQASCQKNIIVNLMDNKYKKQIILNNVTMDINGKQTVKNNITLTKFHIFTEQVPSQNIVLEQKRQDLQTILPFLSSSATLPLLQSPAFLEWLGISNPRQICDEITKIYNSQQPNNPQQLNQQQFVNNPANFVQ